MLACNQYDFYVFSHRHKNLLFVDLGKLKLIAKNIFQVMVKFLMIWGMVDFY